jgi:hypothetical protein
MITVGLATLIVFKTNALMYTSNEWVTGQCSSSLLWPYLLASMLIYRSNSNDSFYSNVVFSIGMLVWGWTELNRTCINDDIRNTMLYKLCALETFGNAMLLSLTIINAIVQATIFVPGHKSMDSGSALVPEIQVAKIRGDSDFGGRRRHTRGNGPRE